MSLIQFRPKSQDPVREILNDEFFFGPYFPSSVLNRGLENFTPALDVAEEGNQYLIKADVPGFNKEDVHLSFDNGILTIEGERKNEIEQKDKKYHRIERSYGKFVRSVNLGAGVDALAIKANYKDGVLTVTVPKSERAKPKTIDISLG